jgi:hypothetical protein
MFYHHGAHYVSSDGVSHFGETPAAQRLCRVLHDGLGCAAPLWYTRNVTMSRAEKAYETALRRRAERAGLQLRRSRARRDDDPTKGKWQLGERSTRGRFVRPVTGWTELTDIQRVLDELAKKGPRP